jgi:hypothetical protein
MNHAELRKLQRERARQDKARRKRAKRWSKHKAIQTPAPTPGMVTIL